MWGYVITIFFFKQLIYLELFPFGRKKTVCHSERSEETLESANNKCFYQRNILNNNKLRWFVI